jgi:hypothetical protein
MGWFSERAPRLGEVQEAQLMLIKRRKAVFFAPHSSERLATIPLISGLSKRLERSGVGCQTHSIEDMRENVISLSVQLARLKLPKAERANLERLLRLKDAKVRLDLLCRIMKANPDAMLLEVHSLDKDYQLADRFESAKSFYRLPGSRVLVLRDFFGEYVRPVSGGIRLLETMGTDGMRKAARIIGLDAAAGRERAMGQLTYLGQNIERAALIEIPAPCTGVPEPGEIRSLTRFEIAYGISMSGSHTLADGELDLLASALL